MDLDSVDYLLFDYKSDNYGGSGKTFDWKILNNKVYDKPFFSEWRFIIRKYQ